MAKPRKPAKILAMNGAFKKNPQRERIDPEPNGPIGDAPEHFEDDERKAWDEIVENQYEGVFTKAHRHIVEYVAEKLAHSRRVNPETGRRYGADKELRISLGALGMDPTNQTKLGIKPEEKKSSGPTFQPVS